MMKDLSRNIRNLRARIGLRQDEFADALGIGQGSLSRYESGKMVPGIDVLYRIARLGGVAMEDLIEGTIERAAIIDLSLTVDELTALMQAVQGELPANLSFADWPSAAAAALHARLEMLARDRAQPGAASRPAGRLHEDASRFLPPTN